MSTQEFCTTCPGNMQIPPGYIEDLVNAKIQSGIGVVENDEYKRRIEICIKCESCLNDIICLKCGCFIQLRALNEFKQCPHPDGDKWEIKINIQHENIT